MKIDFNNTKIAFAYLSNSELKGRYIMFKLINNKYLAKVSVYLAGIGLKLRLPIKGIIKNSVFKYFCGGETLEECKQVEHRLSKYNVGSILDYSSEGKGTDSDFDATTNEVIKTINNATSNKDVPFAVFKFTGIAPLTLLEKMQSGQNLNNCELAAKARFLLRFEKICQTAYNNSVRVMIDAEETWIQEIIDVMTLSAMRKYNKSDAIIINTYQFYIKKTINVFQEHLKAAKEEKFILGAKIVRGAYIEKETIRAQEKSYPIPVYSTKAKTDTAYNKAIEISINNINNMVLVAGTHNEKSCYILTDLIIKKNLQNLDSIYIGQLYGMGDSLTFNLANAGLKAAKYVPYGPVEKAFPYLVRRVDENTSVAGQMNREAIMLKQELIRRKQKDRASS